jgi:hypothetical protein
MFLYEISIARLFPKENSVDESWGGKHPMNISFASLNRRAPEMPLKKRIKSFTAWSARFTQKKKRSVLLYMSIFFPENRSNPSCK